MANTTDEPDGMVASNSYVTPVTAAKLAIVQLHRASRGDYVDDAESITNRMFNCVRLYSDFHFDGFVSDELARIYIDVQSMANERRIESHDLRELNSRLASILEQSRYFEVANRVVVRQMKAVRERLQTVIDQIRGVYELEIANVKRLLNDSLTRVADLQRRMELMLAEKDRLSLQKKQLKNEHKANQAQITRDLVQITELECRCKFLRYKVERSELQNASLKGDGLHLRVLLNSIYADLDNESLNRLRAECKAHNLEEELAFQRLEWQNRKRELDKLLSTEVSIESRSFWQYEVSLMLATLYNDFEIRSEAIKLECETKYNIKAREMQTQISRDSIESESLKNDLARLQRANNSLKLEIEKLEPTATNMDKRMQALREDYESKIKRVVDEISVVQNQRNEAERHIKKLYDEIQMLRKLKVSLESEVKRYRILIEREEKIRSPLGSDSNVVRIERTFEVVTMRQTRQSSTSLLGLPRTIEQQRVHSESEKPDEKKPLRVPRLAESAMWLGPPQLSAK